MAVTSFSRTFIVRCGGVRGKQCIRHHTTWRLMRKLLFLQPVVPFDDVIRWLDDDPVDCVVRWWDWTCWWCWCWWNRDEDDECCCCWWRWVSSWSSSSSANCRNPFVLAIIDSVSLINWMLVAGPDAEDDDCRMLPVFCLIYSVNKH